MNRIPIPSRWSVYTLEKYLWKSLNLRIIHLFIIIFAIITLTLSILYFYYEITDTIYSISFKKQNETLGWSCNSIGTRDSANYNFANPLNLSSVYSFLYMFTEPDHCEPLNISYYNYQNVIIKSCTSDITECKFPEYSIHKGNADTLQKCADQMTESICNHKKFSTNNTVTLTNWYYYNIYINISSFDAVNNGDWVYVTYNYGNDETHTGSFATGIIHNSLLNISGHLNSTQSCQLLFENDNIQFIMLFYTSQPPYSLHYNISQDMILCELNELVETIISVDIASSIFEYQYSITMVESVSNNAARFIMDNVNYINSFDIEYIVDRMINYCELYWIPNYCQYVDVPPYSCHKQIKKTVGEVWSLSWSICMSMYATTIYLVYIILKSGSCKSQIKHKDILLQDYQNNSLVLN
eukprot:594_1